MKIDTICVQGGYSPKNGEPRVLPICQSTTYKYDSSEQMGNLLAQVSSNPVCRMSAMSSVSLGGKRLFVIGNIFTFSSIHPIYSHSIKTWN